MEEESLAPFEVLDKFHVATVTMYMELVSRGPESHMEFECESLARARLDRLCTSKVIIEQYEA